jgi:hypothetical protein
MQINHAKLRSMIMFQYQIIYSHGQTQTQQPKQFHSKEQFQREIDKEKKERTLQPRSERAQPSSDPLVKPADQNCSKDNKNLAIPKKKKQEIIHSNFTKAKTRAALPA